MKSKFDTSCKIVLILMVVILFAACGGKSSSSSNTIPHSEDIFYMHNLVFNGSTLLSTGYNGFGQLGTGSLDDRTKPGYIFGSPPFSGASAGGNYSVAFFNNSTVRSWGSNYYGQLGNGTTTYSKVPVKTNSISNVIAVASGAFHTLALRSDNTLWAWGRNHHGQLGLGDSTSYRTTPHQAGVGVVGTDSGQTPFANISSIAANGYHSLARANGKVWAWGYNGTGQLGLNSPSVSATSTPTIVDGLPSGGASAIAAGGAFSYAVARDGTLWAWGYNGFGQLGNNTKVTSHIPVQVMKAGGGALTGVVQVSAGVSHGLARLDDGSVWAWGYNAFGQLGINSKLDSLVAARVVMGTSGVPLTGATDIRAFGSSSMAMKGGDWYAWGDNAYGQLGIGSKDTQYFPVKMSGF